MTNKSERMQILDMIQRGVITAEEGLRLLRVLEGDSGKRSASLEPETGSSQPGGSGTPLIQNEDFSSERAIGSELTRWRRWWLIPMWVGIAIMVTGAGLMYWALQVSGTGFWFGCAWLPFLLGLAVMLLAWASRSSRWLHLRVREEKANRVERVAISFPIPVRLTGWFLRSFGHRIPKLKDTPIDEIIRALDANTSAEAPLFIEVDEGKGEQVQIYIG